MKLAEQLFNSSSVTCGKRIISIPIDLLNIDYDVYQRSTNPLKLFRKWDVRKCSCLTVNYRRDEKKFYVIDGATRKYVAKKIGVKELACEVFDNLSIEEEAIMFATQYDAVNALKPYDKYRAYLSAKIPSYVAIDKICNEFSLRISEKNSGGKVDGNEITVVDKLTRQVEAFRSISDKEEFLRYVFNIYKSIGWNKYNKGLNTDFFVPVTSIYLNSNNKKRSETSDKLIDVLSKTDPLTVRCVAILRYRLSDPQSCIKCLFNDIIDGNVDAEYIIRYMDENDNVFKKRILEYFSNMPCDSIIKFSNIAEECNVTKNVFNALVSIDGDLKEMFNKMICTQNGKSCTYKVTIEAIEYANKLVA